MTFIFPSNAEEEEDQGEFFYENRLSQNFMKSIPIDSNFQAYLQCHI